MRRYWIEVAVIESWRLSRMNRCTPEEQKVVITLFLTLPTPPIVYYGEEIGMKNLEYAIVKEGSLSGTGRNRATTRTPMQWTSGLNAGFSTSDPKDIYLPVDNAPEFPNVEQQLNDRNSVLNYVKGLISLRNEIPALGVEGEWEYVGDLDNPYPMIYSRTLGDERYLVIFNPSGREVTADLPGVVGKPKWVYGNDKTRVKLSGLGNRAKVKMDPVSVAIIKDPQNLRAH